MSTRATGTAVQQPPPASVPAGKAGSDGGGFGLLLIILFVVGAYALKFQILSELGIGWSQDVGDGKRLYQGPDGEARTAALLWGVFRWMLAVAVILGALWVVELTSQ